MKAVLTGHTKGLGAAIAATLLARGIPVLGLARTRNRAQDSTSAALLQQVELDLADSAAVAQWLAGDALRAFLQGCKTALLINNAGTVQPVGPLETQDVAAVGRAIALNVAAPAMLSAAFTQAAAHAQDRRILHVSSGAARNAYPGWSVYCATKAALDHHARAVVLDNSEALRICSLAPGVIDTDMQAEIRAASPQRFPLRARFEALKRDGALTSPQDAATRLVDYLLDEKFGRDPVADLRG